MSITLATDQIPPDVIGAIVARLRRVTNLMALCPDEVIGGRTIRRVSGRLAAIPGAKGWTGHAVVVRPAGGDGPEQWVPFANPNIDCLCYGATEYEAQRVAWLVAAALEPVERAGFGFVEGDCAVTDIHQIAEPVGFYDRENSAFVRAVSFTVRYGLVPVGAA